MTDPRANTRRPIAYMIHAIALALTAPATLASPLVVTKFDEPDAGSPVVQETRACANALSRRNLTAAASACDRALIAARAERLGSMPIQRLYGGSTQSLDLAVAYSNRAVLHKMLNRDDQAKTDITAAQQHAPGADFVKANLRSITGDRPARAQQ
jgi:hypothetical protein